MSDLRNRQYIEKLQKQFEEAGPTQDSMEKVAEEAVLENERLEIISWHKFKSN